MLYIFEDNTELNNAVLQMRRLNSELRYLHIHAPAEYPVARNFLISDTILTDSRPMLK